MISCQNFPSLCLFIHLTTFEIEAVGIIPSAMKVFLYILCLFGYIPIVIKKNVSIRFILSSCHVSLFWNKLLWWCVNYFTSRRKHIPSIPALVCSQLDRIVLFSKLQIHCSCRVWIFMSVGFLCFRLFIWKKQLECWAWLSSFFKLSLVVNLDSLKPALYIVLFHK